MPKQQKQLDPYDTVFDFLFSSYSSPRQNIVPGRSIDMAQMGGMAEGIMSMAQAPVMYPMHTIMEDVGYELDSLGAVRLSSKEKMNIEVGVGSAAGFIVDPRKIIGKAHAKYKAGKRWGRAGSWKRTIDGAIFGSMGKLGGFSAGTAFSLGLTLRGQGIDYFGYKPSKITHIAHTTEQNRTIGNVSNAYGGSHGIAPSELKKMVDNSRGDILADITGGDADKVGRIDRLKSDLESRGVSSDDADEMAQDFWGARTRSGDFGVMNHSKGVSAMLRRIETEIAQEPNPGKQARMRAYQKWVRSYAKGKGRGNIWALGLNIGRVQHLAAWAGAMSGGDFLAAFGAGNVINCTTSNTDA